MCEAMAELPRPENKRRLPQGTGVRTQLRRTTEMGRRKQGSFHAELCRGLRAESSTALPKAVRPV